MEVIGIKFWELEGRSMFVGVRDNCIWVI